MKNGSYFNFWYIRSENMLTKEKETSYTYIRVLSLFKFPFLSLSHMHMLVILTSFVLKRKAE